MPGDHGVAEGALVLDAEARRLMTDELVDLLERSFVEERVQSFPRCQLALFMLTGDGTLAPGMQGLFA